MLMNETKHTRSSLSQKRDLSTTLMHQELQEHQAHPRGATSEPKKSEKRR